jgi:hypothetical protein
MKAKDYFSKLKEQGKISLEDYDKFLETVPDTFEIPDAVSATLSDKFMTRERAKTDTELRKVFHRELYDAIDTAIHSSLPELDVFDANDIQNEPDTFKKLKKFAPAIQNKVKKAAGAGVEDSAKLKELKQINEDLLAKFAQKDADYQSKLEANNKQWEGKVSDFKLDHMLSEKILKYDFAEGYNKEATARLIKSDLLSTNKLALSENGQISVLEIVDGVAKPKFDDTDKNTPVTIEKLLEAQVKPFLKKNNADEGGEGTQQRQQTTKTIPVNTNGKPREVRSVAVQ